MPDPEKVLRIVYRAVEAIRQTRGRSGHFVQLADADEVLIAGDMHGHLGHFQTIYQRANLAAHPRRHLVLQEVIHSKFRYPNGGDKSHQLLDLFSTLKCQFPNQVHLLMGNHELSQWTDRPILKGSENYNQIFREGIAHAYGDRANDLYQGYLKLFAALPLAIRTENRLFISHSLPAASVASNFDRSLLETDSFPPEEMGPRGQIFGLLWGRDTSPKNLQTFLERADADWLVSGHIPCEEGFAIPSPRHIILDTSAMPASYGLFPARESLTEAAFHASIHLL